MASRAIIIYQDRKHRGKQPKPAVDDDFVRSGEPRPAALAGAKVVIEQGDVLVRLPGGSCQIRSYAAITTCHLCKLSALVPPSPPHPALKRASTALQPLETQTCPSCLARKAGYHRTAILRVRNALRAGHTRIYGPFNLKGTAPCATLRRNAPEEEQRESIHDCLADLERGIRSIKQLRAEIVRLYGKLGPVHRVVMVRKFGKSIFKSSSSVHEVLQEHQAGWKVERGQGFEEMEAKLEGWRIRLRQVQCDIAVYDKVVRKAKSLLLPPRPRGLGSVSRFLKS